MRQTFFRLDEVILELIGPAEPAGDGPARFFGLALTWRIWTRCQTATASTSAASRPRSNLVGASPRCATPSACRRGDRVHGRRCPGAVADATAYRARRRPASLLHARPCLH